MAKQKDSEEILYHYKIFKVFMQEGENADPQHGAIVPASEENQLDLEGLALLLIERERGIVDELCYVMPVDKMVIDPDRFYLVAKKQIKRGVISAREQPLFAVLPVLKEEFEESKARYGHKYPFMGESALREKYNGKVILLWAYNLRPIADVIPSGSHKDVMGQLRKKAGENPNYKPDLKGHMGNPTDTVLLVDFSDKKWEVRGCNTLEEPENDGLR